MHVDGRLTLRSWSRVEKEIAAVTGGVVDSSQGLGSQYQLLATGRRSRLNREAIRRHEANARKWTIR